jgi:hypothetical protein
MVWNDNDLRGDLIQRGYANIESFNWDEAARSFRIVYAYAAGRMLSTEDVQHLKMLLG